MDTKPTVWPVLVYRDAPSAIRFLVDALGFEKRLVVPDENHDVVDHAELVWPEGGGVMLHSADRDDGIFSRLPTGAASLYVVTDEPDEVHDRAVAAGAEVARPLQDEEYGSRGFTVSDPEGNLWSFGTYRGE
jgi:uncharacterized glyoxalase superfamily protein PhnB